MGKDVIGMVTRCATLLCVLASCLNQLLAVYDRLSTGSMEFLIARQFKSVTGLSFASAMKPRLANG